MKRIAQILALAALATGCTVGPNYSRPKTALPPGYKSTNEVGAWKRAIAPDNVPKSAWWEAFGDETLNELQQRALEANQELKGAKPLDNVPKSAWWEAFGDETLNELQQRVQGFVTERFPP